MVRLTLAAIIGITITATPAWAADDDHSQAEAEQAIAHGISYLASEQGGDGGWHSSTYGQLKGGPGITSLVLYSLSRCPGDLQEPHAAMITRGFTYFDPGLRKKQTLAAPDGSLDYPTYAAPLWLSARARLKLPADEAKQMQILDYLLAAQLLEPRGFGPSNANYGGWDFLGPQDAQGISTGTNISLAAFILEALKRVDQSNARVKAAQKQALAWLDRTQNADGGFAFTPESESLNNKALFEDEAGRRLPRSYGTATCDGIRALAAAGVESQDPRLQRASKWLVERPGLDLVPGLEALPLEAGWQRGLRFYYYQSLAQATTHFSPADRLAFRRRLVAQLVEEQRVDGSWINDSPRMREDDPLIATSFALAALGTLIED
jgi:hypothetical protein